MTRAIKILAASAVLSLGTVAAMNLPATSANLAPAKFTDRLPAIGEPAPLPTLTPIAGPATSPPKPIAAATEGARAGDRPGDRLGGVRPACGGAWPYIQAICVADAATAVRPVRVITIERRPEPGVSVLERVGVAEVAAVPALAKR